MVIRSEEASDLGEDQESVSVCIARNDPVLIRAMARDSQWRGVGVASFPSRTLTRAWAVVCGAADDKKDLKHVTLQFTIGR